MTATTPTRKRQVKGSDKANNITLTCKVSALQLDIIKGVLAPNQTIGEWLRLTAMSAAYHEHDRNGRIWANLCQEHHDKLIAGLDSLDSKTILSNWVKASGGAAKLARSM